MTDKILKKEQFEKYNTDLKAKLRWSGTRADYDALPTKDPYTTYYINDEGTIIRNDVSYGGEFKSPVTIEVEFQENVTMDKNLTVNSTGQIIDYGDLTVTGDADMQGLIYADGGIRSTMDTPTISLVAKSDSGVSKIMATNSGHMTHMTLESKYDTGTTLRHRISTGTYSTDGPALALFDSGKTELYCTDNTGNTTGTLKLEGDGIFFNNSPLASLQILFDKIYPIGITFVQRTASDNPNTLFPGTTWTDITATYDGRYEKYDNSKTAGSQIVAGLPNITGSLGFLQRDLNVTPSESGALYYTNLVGTKSSNSGLANYAISVNMNASRSNSIYGNSTTVTPLTTTVKLWQRTA